MKKYFLIATAVLVAAVSFGLYQYFRAPEKALDLSPSFTGTATELRLYLRSQPSEPGTVLEVHDTIRSAESKSITLPGNVIVVKDTSDAQLWPSSGYVEIIGFYQGVEIDEFFGDTLTRIGGAFLLHPTNSEDLD